MLHNGSCVSPHFLPPSQCCFLPALRMVSASTSTATRPLIDASPVRVSHVHSTRSPNARLPLQPRPHDAYRYHCALPSPSARLLPRPCLFEPGCSSPTSHVSLQARALVSHLNPVPSSLSACLPPGPCLFKPGCSSPTSTVSLRARAFVSHPDRVYSSSNVRLPPGPCLFEPERSSPTSTVSIQVRTFVTHPDRVSSSLNARLPPPQCQFERNRSSPTSIRSFRAQSLASHPDRPFEPGRLSPTPIASI